MADILIKVVVIATVIMHIAIPATLIALMIICVRYVWKVTKDG